MQSKLVEPMLPDCPHARVIPEVIGNYRVAGVLGEGGMATVYLGERAGDFEQRVAIKLLRVNLADGKAEESILTSLDHPGIVRFLDRGELPDGRPYLVMEYVQGQTIDRYCEERRLSLAERVKLLLQAANAVEYAHSKFVLHADLKTQNILVTPGGELKLLDFGLARWLGEHGSGETASRFTPRFSSPEQQFGQKLTAASDIFSFGMTGKAILENLELPPNLEAILRKACMREPEQRYRSVRDFAVDLKAFTERRPVAAYRSGGLYVAQMWMQRNRIRTVLIGALVGVLAGSTIGVGVQTAKAAHRKRVAQTRLRELAALTGKLQGDLYTSLPAGASSDPARAELIAATAKTLEKLSRDDEEDPVLQREIAKQYRHLAQLQRQQGDAAAAAISLRAASALSR